MMINKTRENIIKHDQYMTPLWVIKLLLKNEKFYGNIFEPCCGIGNISNELIKKGHYIQTNDIDISFKADYHYDILEKNDMFKNQFDFIITNPPYNKSLEILKQMLNIVKNNGFVIFLLPISFLESKKRKDFIKNNPPYKIYPTFQRILFNDAKSSGIFHAWFIWKKDFKGITQLKMLDKEDL